MGTWGSDVPTTTTTSAAVSHGSTSATADAVVVAFTADRGSSPFFLLDPAQHQRTVQPTATVSEAPPTAAMTSISHRGTSTTSSSPTAAAPVLDGVEPEGTTRHLPVAKSQPHEACPQSRVPGTQFSVQAAKHIGTGPAEHVVEWQQEVGWQSESAKHRPFTGAGRELGGTRVR